MGLIFKREAFYFAGQTLLVGAAGGALAAAAGLPLAWMLGAMWAVILASTRLPDLQIPRHVRRWSLAAIGVYLGANFTPAFAEQMTGAPWAVAAVAVVTLLTTASGLWFVRYQLKTDTNTAILASVPGGLSLLLALAESYRGDKRVVGIVQVIRILIVASVIPLATRFSVDAPAVSVADDAVAAHDIHLLLLAFAAGVGVGALLRSAQMYMMAAIAVAAFICIQDFAAGPPPALLLNIAQVILGASVGSRLRLREVMASGKTAAVAVALTTYYILFTVVAAWLMQQWLGSSFAVWLLALAPGGIAEICLVAQLLDLQPIFVLTMQVARLLIIVATTPLLLRLLARRH